VEKHSVDLNHVVLSLKKKRHIDPAIIVSTPEGTETIGPIDQRWEIGSITKVFTALLLAKLQHTGQLSMTDSVTRYLPATLNLPKNFERITFENLATHQSGLPRLPSGMKLFGKEAMVDPYSIFDEERIFRTIQETKLKSNPGIGRPRYSNYGFGLLGFALEKVTGKVYEDLLMQEIIDPIGLSSATFGDEGLRQGRSGKKEVAPWHMGRFAAMGGLRMNALDLSKFLLTSQDKTHPLAQVFEETFKIRFSSKRAAMGLAWHFFNDEKIVGHSGGTLGARTEGYIDLETENAVVVFGDGNPGTMKAALALLRQE
jgi:D-alanyl-D-alanine-carboxypeptidase/D-alanyl-D-alanine-endopeptidase